MWGTLWGTTICYNLKKMTKIKRKYEKNLKELLIGVDSTFRVKKFKSNSKKKEKLSPTKYLEKNKLDEPIDIAEFFLKNQGIEFKKSDDLLTLFDVINIQFEDVFKYVCEGMLKSNERKIKHQIDSYPWTIANNPQSLLVEYYLDKVEELKKIRKYTIKNLYNSDFLKDWSKENKVKFGSFSEFYKKFIEWKLIYESVNDLI